jgi:hypothetical protein
VLGILWNRYLNKNSLFAKFETSQDQEVFLLGTFHQEHFNKLFRYSLKDIISVIENVEPDVVFIEAREDTFYEYDGVMDGPIDMAVAYSFCFDSKIPVEMIDWWIADNNFKSNFTNIKRDDKIFENINYKLSDLESNKTVLVICGAGHFQEQSKRFLAKGFEKDSIDKKATYFDYKEDIFIYPESLKEVWKKRADFYAYILPEVLRKDENLNEEIKLQFTEGNHDGFYNQMMEYNKLFENNELYK